MEKGRKHYFGSAMEKKKGRHDGEEKQLADEDYQSTTGFHTMNVSRIMMQTL